MRTDKLKKYLLPNLPYLFIGWACLKVGTAYRLAAGADLAHKLVGMVAALVPAFADFAPGLAPFDWLTGIAGAVAIRLVIYQKSKKAQKYRRDEEYGSARWGTEKDINTGQVPNLEKLVAVIRSREVSLTLFYQQLAQCKAIYDKNAETILGNMDSVVFLGGREASTIKEISENWLGKATISMQTEGRSRGQSESYNQNTQRLGRELMTPAELATMPGDRCILQLRGLPPFYSRKYDLKQHPNYRYTAEADKKKNAFSLERLICRRIKKLNPNEQYTVYEAAVPDETPIDEDEDILNYDDLDDPDAFV